MTSSTSRFIDASEVEWPNGRTLEAFGRDARFVCTHYDELQHRYTNEWIAVFEGELVAHSSDSDDLDRQLDDLGLGGRFPYVTFLFDDDTVLVL